MDKQKTNQVKIDIYAMIALVIFLIMLIIMPFVFIAIFLIFR